MHEIHTAVILFSLPTFKQMFLLPCEFVTVFCFLSHDFSSPMKHATLHTILIFSMIFATKGREVFCLEHQKGATLHYNCCCCALVTHKEDGTPSGSSFFSPHLGLVHFQHNAYLETPILCSCGFTLKKEKSQTQFQSDQNHIFTNALPFYRQ